MNAPQSIEYQGETLFLLETKQMQMHGKPMRYSYGFIQNGKPVIRFRQVDFGNIDWERLQAENSTPRKVISEDEKRLLKNAKARAYWQKRRADKREAKAAEKAARKAEIQAEKQAMKEAGQKQQMARKSKPKQEHDIARLHDGKPKPITIKRKSKQEWADGVDGRYQAGKQDSAPMCKHISMEEYEAMIAADKQGAKDWHEDNKAWFEGLRGNKQ